MTGLILLRLVMMAMLLVEALILLVKVKLTLG